MTRRAALAGALAAAALGLAPATADKPPRDPETAAAAAAAVTGPLTAKQLLACCEDWRALEPGLELRALRASSPTPHGDELIVALRIDPARYAFVFLAKVVEGASDMTAAEWAAREGLVAATNAGMYGAPPDRRPVGFARAGGVDVNPAVSSDNTVFAFGARDPALRDVRLIDRACDDLDVLRPAYDNLLQSIRMISCDGRNVWAEQDERWSMAALAEDTDGRVLFVHVRSPYSVHDFIDMLQAAPLDIARAMYLEGAHEATLYAHAGGIEVERVGGFRGAYADVANPAWPLPNVIGVRSRTGAPR